MLHRHNNYLLTQLSEDRLIASVISDGDHLSRTLLKVIRRVKDRERLIIISDASSFAGLAPGTYRAGDKPEVEILESGRIMLAGTEALAGSGHFLDHCVSTYAGWGIGPLEEALILATSAPARYLNLNDRGEISQGRRADLDLWQWNQDKKELELKRVICGGKVVKQ
jgi:N-acetylglucosamine-6-phosphate deacetylase